MQIMIVLEDIPAFVGLDEKVWKLKRGDVLSVNPGLPFRQAKILIDREKARWVN